jgi:hypothetical protein
MSTETGKNDEVASEVLVRLCANTDPQRDSMFRKRPSNFWAMRPLKSRLKRQAGI